MSSNPSITSIAPSRLAPDSAISLAVRVGGGNRTVIKYVQSNSQLQVDLTSSGNISYDPAAGVVHVTSFSPDTDGVVHVRVLVDEFSVGDKVRW
jgi:hypothetical protein